MQLDQFIESNKEAIIERWQEFAVDRLSLDLDESQLLNDLPRFIDDIVRTFRAPEGEWPHIESAREHGQQRVRVGVQIGSLIEEMTMVGEAVAMVAEEQGEEFSSRDLLQLMSIIGRGASASVSAYAKVRDQELSDQAARHFSFIAHEIRNPLNSARLAANLLALAPEDERKKHSERLDRSLSQLGKLVDDSLIEARLFGNPRVDLQQVNGRELVEQLGDDFAPQIADRDLVLAVSAAEFTLQADPTLVYSALGNLLSNAIKYTPKGKRIDMRGRLEDGHAIFEVQDECGGIPPDIEPRLFEPFLQGQGPSSESGSGLGLLIVKQVMEAHEGTVQVNNQIGVGCCFRLDFPQKPES